MAVVCVFFCDGLDDLRVACALVILPPVALLCLRRAFSALPVADRPSPVIPKFTYPWKIFVLLALYSFAYRLRQHQLAAGAGMHSSVSTAIVMAVLFASAYFFSNRFNIGTLYRSPLVLIVCGFLLVPVEGVFRHGGVQLSHLHELLARGHYRGAAPVRHLEAPPGSRSSSSPPSKAPSRCSSSGARESPRPWPPLA